MNSVAMVYYFIHVKILKTLCLILGLWQVFLLREVYGQCMNPNEMDEDEWVEFLEGANIVDPALIDGLVDCFLDWIDKGDEHRLNGAESDDDFYEDRGYAVSNAPITDVSQLSLIKYFSDTILYGGTNESGVVNSGIIYRLSVWTTNGVCDHDGDTLPDWYEDHFTFLSPTNSNDATLDYDNDNLINQDEFTYQTDPENPDSDHDSIPDGHEVLSGTDPTDEQSFLQITSELNIHSNTVDMIIHWESVPGVRYRISSTDDLGSGPYSVIASNIMGQVGTQSYTCRTHSSRSSFFRLEAQ
ncbi:MAG: hypothetical protein AAF492_14005 [Verrucomicrobiota bacterium]